ncbi:MAG TPA: acyl-CoA thioesterase [Bacteroidales bacterium]|nr:acyl-CoA thioesterase [Bacteroidales bacterium]
MARKLTVNITARGYELDSYNHINNAVYLNYFEHGRWEYFRQLGLYDVMKESGSLPVVTDIHIRYQREVKLFDDLEIESHCVHESPYLVFRQRIFNRTTGASAARAETKLIFTGPDRLACDVPQVILDLLNTEMNG